MRRGLWVLPLAASTLLVGAHPAWACDGAEKTPRFVTEGPLPKNAAGALWWNGRWADLVVCGPAAGCKPRLPDPKTFAIEPLPKGEPLEVSVEPVLAWKGEDGGLRTDAFLVRARAALAPGRYRFVGPAPTKPVELEVQEAPLHGEPATMTVGKVVPGSIRAVQPPSEGAVIRELSVMLPAKATPFAGALAWETTIDGKRWRERTKRCEYAAPHHPLAGAGRERLSMSCSPHRDETDPLTPGQAHQVRVRAFLPGTTVDFVAQQPLTLTCPDAATPSAPSSGGCAYGHRPGRSPLWMLLLAGGLVRARGRRRRPPTSRTRSA